MSRRILVIEDNRANLDLMTYLLRAFKYEALTAEDGEQGVETAVRERPDAIVCDVQLPRMDGFEVVRHLKAHPATRSIPIVAVTAFAMVGDRDRVLAAGFDGYIGKPIAPETFVSQVEQFLRLEPSMPGPAPSEGTIVEPPRAPAPRKGRILVVDNNLDNRVLMQTVLEPAGYAVSTANSVGSAFAAARVNVPDAILCDLNMPGEDGFCLLLQVRADAALRHVPFMISSVSDASEDSRQRALSLGAGFLPLPADAETIHRAVDRLIAKG